MTAKELFDKMLQENDECTSTEMMIEFAKYHVTEALMSAKKSYQLIVENEEDNTTRILPNKSYRLNDVKRVVVDELSIILSYDLDNIE